MAPLAPNPVGELIAWAALVRCNVIGMTRQAHRIVLGAVLQPEIGGNALADVITQHGIGLGVLIARFPNQVLVLRDTGPGRAAGGAMAVVPGAACNAEMNAV